MDDPQKYPRRDYYELKEAKDQNEKVSDEQLLTFERELQLIRAAVDLPKAFVGCGISSSMLHAPDYIAAWDAVQQATLNSNPSGPIGAAEMVAELRRIDPVRFATGAGDAWVSALLRQAPVAVTYAFTSVVPDILAKHQLREWHGRQLLLAERIPTEKSPAALREEWITEATRITRAVDGKRFGTSLRDVTAEMQGRGQVIKTGIQPVDRVTGGGPCIGHMMCVGAGTGVGKSYFAQRIGRSLATNGTESLYVSVEDSLELYTCRMLADYAAPPVTPVSIRSRLYAKNGENPPDAANEKTVNDALDLFELQSKGISFIEYCPKWSVSKICNVIRRYVYTSGVKVVIVDYLQAIQADEPMNNKTQEISYIVSTLKKLAVDCGFVLILMSQLTRESYKKGEEPVLQDFKYAGDIENETELAVLLWKDENDVVHAKIPKIKWTKAGRDLRYIVSTNEITGCFKDWNDDFSTRDQENDLGGGQGGGRRGSPRRGGGYGGRR